MTKRQTDQQTTLLRL